VSKRECGPTHHFACDCREKKIESLLEAGKAIDFAVKFEGLNHPSWIELMKDFNKAIKAMED
jgi:hypothetical protein